MSPLPATQVLPGWYSVQSFFDIDGHLVKNTALSVVASGGSTLASIYNADGSASANPMPTSPQLTAGKAGGADNDGNVQFGAAAGLYDLYAGATYIGTVEVTAQDADLLHTHGDETKHGVLTFSDGIVVPAGSITAGEVGAIPISQVTGLAAELATDEANIAANVTAIAAKVAKTGDTMSGSLTLAGNTGVLWADSSGLGFASSAAAFSSDALVNDVVIRSINGRVVIQHAAGAAGLIVDSAGITAKQTILANAAVPIKLPTGTAGQVLTSDASGNLALAAPGVANPNQWTENDQLTGGAVTIPMASGGVQQVTMNANVTSATVTGAAKGMVMVLRLKQDATGGRTWTWFTNVTWGPQGVPYLSTLANSQQTFTFEYDGTNWVEVERTLGDSGWVAFPLANGWTNYTIAPWAAGGYRRMHNRVELMGAVNGSAATTASPMTLPAGFRPTKTALEVPCSHGAANAAIRVNISTTGVVTVTDWTAGTAANFGFVDLKPLSFPVD